MSSSDEDKAYEVLGLRPDATMDEVKARFRELNDAYLKILQSSKRGSKKPSQPPPVPPTKRPEQAPPSPHRPHTEPIAKIRARLAKGEIDDAQFERLAKERYNYLKDKSFTDLTDSEFEERLHGFEGLRFL